MGKRFERLIMHVGMHKTGSTALQHAFAKMRFGPYGPLDLIDKNHSVVCNMWFGPVMTSPQDLLLLGHSQASGERHLNRAKERVARQLERSSKRELVVSAEWLSNGIYPGEGRLGMLRRFKAEFEPHFERIEVYAYVRPPIAYITGACQQIIQARPVFLTPWPRYKKRFRPMFEVFGRENIHLRVFERDRLLEGDVVADFYDWVGWPQTRFKAGTRNESLSAAGVALAHCYQRNRSPVKTRLQNKAKNLVVSRMMRLGGPSFALSDQITGPLLEEHSADIAWMEQVLGEPLNDAETWPRDDSFEIGSADDLKRAAARFAPLLRGEDAVEPPDDPELADAMAWDIVRRKFRI